MCPQVLPRELFNEVIDDIINYIKPKLVGREHYSYWLTCLEDLKNRQTFQEKYENWESELSHGKEILGRVDLWRDNVGKIEEIFSQNPKVLNWWNNIKKYEGK